MAWWEIFLSGFTAGIAALSLLAFLLIAYWTRKATRVFRDVSAKYSARISGPREVPAKIEWRPSHAESEQRARFAAIGQVLEPAGFRPVGTYTDDESGILMRGWINTEQSVIAAAYQFLLGTPWLEFVSMYTDESACVFSNAEMADLDHPPNHIRHYLPEVSPRELLSAFLEQRQSKELMTVTAETVTSTLERIHATESEWRKCHDL